MERSGWIGRCWTGFGGAWRQVAVVESKGGGWATEPQRREAFIQRSFIHPPAKHSASSDSVTGIIQAAL